MGRLTRSIAALEIRGARAVRPEGAHLTLKFLGDVGGDAVPRIAAAMRRAASRSTPFRIALSQPGAFPNPGAARVVWVGVDGDTGSLRRLQRNVEDEMEALGFGRERRGFDPHITAARVRDGVRASDRRRILDTALSIELACFPITVESISLMRSDLRPGGAIYSRLHSAALDGSGC